MFIDSTFMLLYSLLFYFLHLKKNNFKLNIFNLLLFYFYFVKIHLFIH